MFRLLLLSLVVVGFIAQVLHAEDKNIGDFTLKDQRGRATSLAHFKDSKAVVVIFLGTQCPVMPARSRPYLP